MKPKQVKNLLTSVISEVASAPQNCCVDPNRNFTRNRKISLKTLIRGIINMEGKSLSNELIDVFPKTADIPSVSAFVQQRDKIKPEAFETVFNKFTSRAIKPSCEMVTLAVDGSDIRLPDNPDELFTRLPGCSTQDPYNCLHLNALYDLGNHIYRDAIIQNGAQENE